MTEVRKERDPIRIGIEPIPNASNAAPQVGGSYANRAEPRMIQGIGGNTAVVAGGDYSKTTTAGGRTRSRTERERQMKQNATSARVNAAAERQQRGSAGDRASATPTSTAAASRSEGAINHPS